MRQLVRAARAVDRRHRGWGPVDDGSPEGARFDKALDALHAAALMVELFAKRWRATGQDGVPPRRRSTTKE